MGTTTTAFARRLGTAVIKAGGEKGLTWFNSHMAAASEAILNRIPLVDFTLEVRDARIPISSQYGHMRNFRSSRRIIVLNKVDLADCSRTREWKKYFEEQNCICYGTNSHNKENIKDFLNFLQAQVRELRFHQSKFTTTMMLVGIPNVGKSALANSLHHIGRISAAVQIEVSHGYVTMSYQLQEKGKLKHAIVSPLPGETQNISSLKIASHPNIYVLDTPGVLLPEILNIEMGSKIALTGAIKDCLVGEYELARYFLAILNLSDEYKHWESLALMEDDGLSLDSKLKHGGSSESNAKKKKIFPTDHTQDIVVRDVRKTIIKTITSFSGNMEDENELTSLIEAQIAALREPFQLPLESGENGCQRVCTKLLNLYRTGRLGHYTLDTIPKNIY